MRTDHKVIDKKMGTKQLEPQQPKKIYPPPEKRDRNEFGDFIVTKIEIPDLKPKEAKDEEKDEDESSDESEPEEQQPEEESKDEAPKLKEKKLSKKEQKKLEDAEFERVFNEMGIKDQAQ